MKKVKIFMLIIIFLLVVINPIYAHPGRTDSNGGHNNRSTGEYHYHHGKPEHQHVNGFCPYSSNNEKKTNIKYDKSSDNDIILIGIGLVLGIVVNNLYRKRKK